MNDLIRKHALANAVKFNGKPNVGAIIGKLIAEDPALKERIKEISLEIQETLKEISGMSVDAMQAELVEKYPELLEKKVEERDIFAFLKLPDGVITAFPPGPEKYPHIGHAKAILLNYLAATSKGGKFILRFEDTNPKTAKEEYYEAMIDGFSWLGVKWDELLYASDFMDLFYAKCEHLLKEGHAYVDTSSPEEVKKSREKGDPTTSRDNAIEQNLDLWHRMGEMEEGSAIVRLKIDLKAKNSTMRDPTIFRIVKAEHPRQKTKYTVWPNYDFQNAIMDSESGIDMRLRSKEFELRSELQRWIQEKLDITLTKTHEFGRFVLKGVITSGREIREKVESGELMGWDDPSLVTLTALRRRGFLPAAIESFVLSTGISKAEATTSWDDLILHNKRLLDKTAKRYSALLDPIEVTISGAPEKNIELHLNPNEKKGGRPMHVHDRYLLAKKDVESDEKHLRLMDNINISKEGDHFTFESESHTDFQGKRVINFLPADEVVDIEVLMPDKKVLRMKAEKNINDLSEGEVIQFERFGFCRLDDKQAWRFYYSHN